MRIALRFAIVLSGLLALPLYSVGLLAADQQATERQIKKLQTDIKSLERKLRSSQGERSELTKALRQSEKQAGELNRQIERNQRQIKQHRQRLGNLDQQRDQLNQQRQQQLQALEAEVVTAYRTGRQDRLRLLLNQQQPERVVRLLRYHQYLSDARSEALAALEQTLAQLDQVEQNHAAEQQRLTQEQQQLQQRRNQLQSSRQQRQQALAKIQKQLKSQNRSLQRLKADQQRLQQVLKELQQALALNELKVSTQAFAKLKGRLGWPTTRTRVLSAFGSRSSQGIRSDGMLIASKQGAAVKTVHNGRVVFSDWLRGYGLLLIVDHGDGYMSLYGHNQSLLKQVGDWVGAGEQVATVGDSGGQARPGLYFAIRYQGKPVDPIRWLKRG